MKWYQMQWAQKYWGREARERYRRYLQSDAWKTKRKPVTASARDRKTCLAAVILVIKPLLIFFVRKNLRHTFFLHGLGAIGSGSGCDRRCRHPANPASAASAM